MIPLLAGLPWLAGILGWMFSGVFTWFLKYVTKKIAIIATVVIVIAALTAGLFLALKTTAQALSLVAPSWMTDAAYMVLPPNADECLTAYISARVLRWAYDWNIKIIQYKLF